MAIAAVMAAALAVPTFSSGVASAANATITVSNTPSGTVQTQLSTNNVWSGMVDQFPAAVQNFNALALPLVRIHIGDDGSPAAMPEVKQGSWSFAALDSLVNDEASQGRGVVMNVKFAPDWMWSCYPNSIGVNGSQGTGTVKDTTFATFAAYMARLVSYYNTGSMTTESGAVVTNPAGAAHRQTYWELWNEPDLNNETPCAPSSGVGLSPAQYVTMWNAVTAAMLKVDPTLRFVGPATAGGQFGSSSGAGNDYITQLESGATVKPYALSFHGYGYWDNTVPDKWIFDGDGTSSGAGGIADIVSAAKAIHTTYPGTPIWITEVNVNAAWDNDTYKRPWTAFGAAWWGSLFSQLAPLGVQMIHQYEVMESPQFGLLDDATGAPRLPYWNEKVLNAAFPPGSTILSATSTNTQVQTLAAQRPDGKVSVLVVNRQLDSTTTKGGAGQPATVTIGLSGITPTAVTAQQIDSTTNPTSGPPTTTLTPTSPLQVNLPGYGFAVLTITSSSAPPPPPAATAVSLRRSVAQVRYGGPVTLTARLTGPGGSPLVGQRVLFFHHARGARAWLSAGESVTDGTGSARAVSKPPRNQDYFATYAGSTAYTRSASPVATVNVSPAVTVWLSKASVRRGTTDYVHAAVKPNLSGRYVTLQRYYSHRWHRVTAHKLGTRSTYAFAVRWTSRGTRSYRVVISNVPLYVTGYSATARLTVT